MLVLRVIFRLFALLMISLGFSVAAQSPVPRLIPGRFLALPARARDVLAVVASTNPACAEDLTTTDPCVPGPPPSPTTPTGERL